MPVNLSVKSVPDELARRLRARAERNHRSLQGELMAILEDAAGRGAPLTPAEALAEVRALGLRTRATSARSVREDRDGR